MRRLVIRLSILAIGATALTTVSLTAPADAKNKGKAAGRHMHHMGRHKQRWTHRYRGAWYGVPAQAGGSTSQSGWVCPGIGRSFECKIWPPPFEDDPDRKTSKY